MRLPNLRFFKNNFQMIYSLSLIIFIPATVIVNTIILTDSFKKNIDKELYSKAILVGDAIGPALAEVFTDREALQKKVEAIAAANSEIGSLELLMKDDDDFITVASTNRGAIGRTAANLNYLMAWHESRPVAAITRADNPQSPDERFWSVTMPLLNDARQQLGLLSLNVSLKVMDEMTKEALIKSYLILSVSIVIIILLLANNTRLFEYAALYRRLKEVDRMKDEFISMASHELRTPVTGIRGYVSMILEGNFGNVGKEVKKNLLTVKSAADRLSELVEDLLDVSRIEQGRIAMDSHPLDLGAVIDEVVKELRIQAEAKALTLEFRPHAEPLPSVNADPARLKQVLFNLIGNSVKYTERGGIEIVTGEKQNGKVLEIRIKDTGIGMNSRDRERLFEKFYRIQNDKTKEITGTGLGLWITKRIVELMKGSIYVDSIENVGTQVTLTFPTVNR